MASQKGVNLVHYASLSAFHKDCPIPGSGYADRYNYKEEWAGNQTYGDAYTMLFQGDPEATDRADKLLEQIESDGLELVQTKWETQLVGFVPCVPAYLAGDPESMFAPVDSPSDTAPMRVFASVCLSAMFSRSDAEKRGAAILALVRRLSLIRPVELLIYSDQRGAQPVIRLETNPLDLPTASYAMGNAGFLRRLCFAWGDYDRGFDGNWAQWGGGDETKAREALGAEPHDLVITGSHSDHDVLTDPVAWVNAKLAKYGGTLENTYD